MGAFIGKTVYFFVLELQRKGLVRTKKLSLLELGVALKKKWCTVTAITVKVTVKVELKCHRTCPGAAV